MVCRHMHLERDEQVSREYPPRPDHQPIDPANPGLAKQQKKGAFEKRHEFYR